MRVRKEVEVLENSKVAFKMCKGGGTTGGIPYARETRYCLQYLVA